MRWLHISDVHYDPAHDGSSTKQLRDKLPRYLRDHDIRVDHVFVTGDFRHARYQDDTDEVAQRAVDYVLQVAESVGVTDRARIHIVPGNHDLARNEEDKAPPAPPEKTSLQKARERYDPDVGRFTDGDQDMLLSRFGFFRRVSRLLYPEGSIWPEGLSPLHAYRCYEDFSILYLNTAVTAGSDDERHNLVIGNHDLYEALERIKAERPDAPILALAHHAVEYMTERERKAIEVIWRDYPMAFYLCGDAHRLWHRKINNTIEITMGCIKQESGVQAAFSIGEITGDGFLVKAFKWDPEQRGWEPNPAFDEAIPGNRPPQKESSCKIVTKTRPFRHSDFFRGRESLIQQIRDALQGNEHILIMSGMGGMGKTELCRYVFDQAANGEVSGIHSVGWIFFQDSAQASFMEQFPAIPSGSDPTAYLENVRQYCALEGKKLLLFVDNANELSAEDARFLSGLECRLVVTARTGVMDRVKPIEVDRLQMPDCVLLYRDHSRDHASPQEIVEAIVTLADRNTLAVELLAKTQYACGLTAEAFLAELKAKDFNLEGIGEPVQYQHNPELQASANETRERLFLEHMGKVFDIADIQGEALRVLRLFCLFPPEPLPIRYAREWLALDGMSAVNELVKKGWLIRRDDAEPALSIHPVIAAVCRQQAMPDEKSCEHLIESLANTLLIGVTEVFTTKLYALPFAVSVSRYIDGHSVNYAWLLQQIGYLFYQLADYASASAYYHKALVIFEKVLGKEHPLTTTIYQNIARVHSRQGDYPKALEGHTKVLAIRKKALGKKHPDTATIYHDIAGVYDSQGNYPKALEWYMKALAISEKVHGKEHLSIAATYNNIAVVHCRQGDYLKALKRYIQALAICEKVLGKEHPLTATTYNNIAGVYDGQGDYPKALEWYMEALAIFEKVLGKEHPDTATTYHNIAGVHDGQSDYPEALKWYMKALAIREKALGKEHPDTATTYHNIAGVYDSQGDYLKALEGYMKALAIREKMLGREHLSTAATYNNIAWVYNNQDDYPKALEGFLRAYCVFEKKLGGTHPSTIIVRDNMKSAYEQTNPTLPFDEWFARHLAK